MLTNVNMTDIETCYKAFRSSLITKMPLTSSGFGMEVEITALITKTKARIYEVPISYHGRTYDEGKKIKFIDGLAALWYIFYYNLVASRTAVRGFESTCTRISASATTNPLSRLKHDRRWKPIDHTRSDRSAIPIPSGPSPRHGRRDRCSTPWTEPECGTFRAKTTRRAR